MAGIFVNRFFLFKVMCLIEVNSKFMQEQKAIKFIFFHSRSLS